MFPATTARIQLNTANEINARIRRQTLINIRRFSSAGPDTIDQRLRELDAEWDIERCLETAAPSLTLLGMSLGLGVSKKFFVLPFLVQSFLLFHALQGWCPPVPFLRRLGVRTASEIDEERYALKALRGDFTGTETSDVGRVMQAVER